jgi:hypothetical protein
LFALALGSFFICADPASADDPPPWRTGIPWPTTMPWPTARPLGVGESWSPGISNPSVIPTATPIPMIVAPKPVPAVPVIVIPAQPLASPTPIILAQPPAPPPPTSAPQMPASGNGATPDSALNAAGTWTTIGANTSVWYRIGSGGVHMDVFLDSNAVSSLTLEIYAPNQFNKPIGMGTPQPKNDARLVWAGGHWNSNGDWMAKIINGSAVPVQYALSSSVRDISNKTCYSYWEYIGPNLVYWTECEKK